MIPLSHVHNSSSMLPPLNYIAIKAHMLPNLRGKQNPLSMCYYNIINKYNIFICPFLLFIPQEDGRPNFTPIIDGTSRFSMYYGRPNFIPIITLIRILSPRIVHHLYGYGQLLQCISYILLGGLYTPQSALKVSLLYNFHVVNCFLLYLPIFAPCSELLEEVPYVPNNPDTIYPSDVGGGCQVLWYSL